MVEIVERAEKVFAAPFDFELLCIKSEQVIRPARTNPGAEKKLVDTITIHITTGNPGNTRGTNVILRPDHGAIAGL